MGVEFGLWSEISFTVPGLEDFVPRITSTKSTHNTITLNWTANELAGAFNVIPDDTVYYLDCEFNKSRIYVEAESITLNGLKADKAYGFKIYSGYPGDYWSDCTEVTVRTKPLPEVTGLNYEITNYNQVKINWHNIPEAVEYEIILNEEHFTQNMYAPNFIERQFDFETENLFEIRYFDGDNYSPWTEMIVTVPYPTISKAYNITSKSTYSSVTLNWEVEGTVEHTYIEYGDKKYNTKNKYITITGLEPDTEYTFSIFSINDYTESEKEEITVRTAEPPDLSGMYDEITFTTEKDKMYSLSLSAESIAAFNDIEMILEYRADELELLDFAAQTNKIELSVGKIEGTDLEIISIEPGKVVFKSNKNIPEEKVWSGALTMTEEEIETDKNGNDNLEDIEDSENGLEEENPEEDSEEDSEETKEEETEEEGTDEEEGEDSEEDSDNAEEEETDLGYSLVERFSSDVGSALVKVRELDFDDENSDENDNNNEEEEDTDEVEEPEENTGEADEDSESSEDIHEGMDEEENAIDGEDEIDSDHTEAKPFILSDADISEILKLSKEYKVDAQMLLDVAVENEIEPELFWLYYGEMQSVLGLYRSTDIVPYISENDVLTRNMPSAPFNFESNHTEMINLNTGSVLYGDNIVSLAGRGGLDLNLSLVYDSNESSDDLYYGAYNYIWIAEWDRDDRVYYMWRDYLPINLNEGGKKLYKPFNARYIAAGWKLNTTRIEFSENFYQTSRYLKLENGGSYYIEKDLSLKNYELKDIKLERDTYVTYPQSYYVVTYASGIKEYLNSQGSLVAKRDKHGNVITYVDKSSTEIEITDTMGRKVNITLGDTIKVTLPDKNTITYETSSAGMFNGNLYRQLTKKTDQLGNETKFNYEIGVGEFDFFHHKTQTRYLFNKGIYQRLVGISAPPSQDQWLATSPLGILSINRRVAMIYEDFLDYWDYYNGHSEEYTDINKVHYHLLKKITYPTGTVTNFSYDNMMGKSGGGYVQYFAVDSRWDELPGESGKFNHKYYTYGPMKGSNRTHTNYTGYVLGEEVEELPGYYTYQVYEEKLSLGYTEYIYNNKHLKIEENFTGNNGYISKIRYTYNSYNLPTKIVKTVTSGVRSMVTTELYEYDQYGNIIYHWNSQAEGGRDNEFRTAYTYDTAYNMLTDKTYKTDKSTTVRESYTLTANKRSVQSYRIYENNVLAARIDYTYDAYGNVITAKNYLNSSESILQTSTYDKGVYPVSTTQDNVTIKYTYDTMGNVKTAVDGNGNSTSFEYDKKNREILVTYADGGKVVSKYDDKKNTVIVKDTLGYETEYQYNGYGKIAKILIPGTSKVLSSYRYGTYGELLSETDANNHTTTYKYDNLLRMISETKGGSVKTIEYTDVYTAHTARVTTTAKGSGSAPDIKTSVYIDKYGFTTAESGYLGSTEVKKTYEYDYTGRVISELNPQHAKDGLKFTNQYTYDALGNVVQSVNALNYATKYEYDWLGRQTKVTDPKGNIFSYVYDGFGNVVEERKPFEGSYDSVKKYTYDKNNNTLSEVSYVQKPGEEEKEVTVKYQYNNRNHLIKVENSGVYTSYEYDKAGNMLKLITGNGEQVTAYEYDRFGNVILFTDAEGNTEKYEYDLKNNLIQKIDRNGNIIKNTYDSIGRLIKTEGQTETGKAAEYMSFSYSNNGMVLTEANESLKTTYTYDSLGRTIKSEDSRGTAKSYGYDLNNNRISQNIAVNGKSVYKADYSYDRLDRLKNLIKDGKAEAVYSYDENGNRASLTYGNGIQTSYTYNKANLITNLVNKTNGKVLSSYEYSYYLDGNQASKSDHEGTVTTYIYDDLNRLLSEREISGDNSVAKSYEYDNTGNRAFMTVEENGEVTKTTYTYDKTNRLLREESREIGTLNQVINAYVYDGNGNQTMKLVSTIKVNEGTSTPRLRIQLLTDDGTMDSKYSYLEPELRGSYKDISTAEQPALKINLLEGFVSTDSKTEIYTYDIFNRLAKVQMPGVKAEYTYKSDGLRISKNVNGEIINHIWDNGFLIAEADENFEAIDAYYRGIDLIYSDAGGYYVYNAHGDVVQLADTEGEIVKEYSFDAFGVEKDIDEADENPFRYCGEYYDKETGTIYLRARYYVPRTGRFMSEDGIRDGLNWYTYANGNPIFFIDPLGLAIEKLTDWLGSFKDYYSSVNWDANTKTATVYLKKGSQSLIIGGDRGITVYYTVGIEGTYIGVDGKMYVETGNKNNSSKKLWNYIDPSLEYDPVKDTVILATAIVAIAKGSEAIIDRVSHAYDAVKGAGNTVDPNKLKHLFDKPEHNFESLLKHFGGNQTQTYNAIQNAAQKYVTQNNMSGVINATNEITVKVSGYDVTVRGNIVEGILKIGTAFIKP